jgi:hypothetical protein
MSKALVIGQSHSAAISDALDLSPADSEQIVVKRLVSKNRTSGPDVVSTEEAVRMAGELREGSAVFLAMMGTGHNLLGLLRAGAHFDFSIGAHDAPDPAARERIPHRAMASAFEEYLQTGRPLEKIHAAAKVPVFLLGSPPPKESSSFMLDYLLRQSKRERYGRSVERAGIERP